MSASHYFVILVEAAAEFLFADASTAVTEIVCEPLDITFPAHEVVHVVTFAQVVSIVPSAAILMELIPLASVAETEIFNAPLPFILVPVLGETMVTFGATISVVLPTSGVAITVTEVIPELPIFPATSYAFVWSVCVPSVSLAASQKKVKGLMLVVA